MTKIQNSWLNMYLAVVACLDRFQSLWNSQAALVRRRKELGDKLDLIQVITEEQERDRTGVTVDKHRLAGLLIDGMMAVAGPLRGLAADRVDADLRQRSAMTRTELSRLPKGRLAERAKSLHALAKTHGEILEAEYGLGEETLAALENRAIAFNAMVVAPRNNLVERTRLTALLDSELRSTSALLKEFFDPIVSGMADREVEFFAEYRKARALVKQGVRRKKEKGEAKPAAEKKPKAGKKSGKRKVTSETATTATETVTAEGTAPVALTN